MKKFAFILIFTIVVINSFIATTIALRYNRNNGIKPSLTDNLMTPVRRQACNPPCNTNQTCCGSLCCGAAQTCCHAVGMELIVVGSRRHVAEALVVDPRKHAVGALVVGPHKHVAETHVVV
ncbi:20958_t:CDS:2 [Gigaspora margarita]|uniref:20958_t:CDS:1 n=1 Tax=Gigaspora margarita TaxID=4874 RepID=A0ABM8W5W4_GIGMA|nr:20958_t:CDS:2 [Gigaspora margarita]